MRLGRAWVSVSDGLGERFEIALELFDPMPKTAIKFFSQAGIQFSGSFSRIC